MHLVTAMYLFSLLPVIFFAWKWSEGGQKIGHLLEEQNAESFWMSPNSDGDINVLLDGLKSMFKRIDKL
jgi:hypothetical protein